MSKYLGEQFFTLWNNDIKFAPNEKLLYNMNFEHALLDIHTNSTEQYVYEWINTEIKSHLTVKPGD